MSNTETHQMIRELERDLLDQRHRRFPLMQREQALAIAHVLKVHADAYRDFRKMDLSEIGDVDLRTILHFLNAGTAHAVRWLLDPAGTTPNQARPPWTVLDEEAIELIKWGGSYAELAQ